MASIYRTFYSPFSSIEDSGRVLQKVQSRLQMLSPQRREQIEAACQRESSSRETPNGLESLERELEDLFDLYCELKIQYEEMSFTESHLPWTLFRERVAALKERAKALLKDTYKTTTQYPSVGFGSPVEPAAAPNTLPRLPSPNLMAAITAELGSSPGADNIPMARIRR